MSTAILSPEDDRNDSESRFKDDETRLLPHRPSHTRCPVCMAFNHPAAGHCIYCGKVFDDRCPTCGL